jgi:hypothetical protein
LAKTAPKSTHVATTRSPAASAGRSADCAVSAAAGAQQHHRPLVARGQGRKQLGQRPGLVGTAGGRSGEHESDAAHAAQCGPA